MISHGRKSDKKCYVEELARFAVVIKEFCLVGRDIICCFLNFVFIFILEVIRLMFRFRQSHHYLSLSSVISSS